MTDWKTDCLTCTAAYIQERIGRCRHGRLQYPSLTAGHDRIGIATLDDKIGVSSNSCG